MSAHYPMSTPINRSSNVRISNRLDSQGQRRALLRPLCAKTETEMDARLFAHIHLDSRLSGTLLEGASFRSTTTYIIRILQFLIQNSDLCGVSKESHEKIVKSLECVKQQFVHTVSIEDRIEKICAHIHAALDKNGDEGLSIQLIYKYHLEPLAKFIFQKIENSETDRILIPGGWLATEEGQGHAMAYQFIRQADGSFLFVVFNTGAGIQYHLGSCCHKQKYFPVRVFHIPKNKNMIEKIKTFIADLIFPNIAPRFDKITGTDKDWIQEKQYNADRLYNDIIPKVYLLGNSETPVQELDPSTITSQMTQGQQSGTCSMRVLMPILHAALGDHAFQQFLFQLRLQSLWDHYHIQKKLGKLGNRMIRRQLEAGRSKLARTTRIMMERRKDSKKLLEESEALIAITLLDQISADLKTNAELTMAEWEEILRLETKQGRSSCKTAPSLTPGKKDDIFRIESQDLKADLDSISPDSQIFHSLSLPRQKNGDVDRKSDYEVGLQPIKQKQILPILDITQFISPLEYLKHCKHVLKKNQRMGISNSKIIADFEKIFLSLPIDFKQAQDFWNNLGTDPKDVKKSFDLLQYILRYYGYYCFHDGGTAPLARQILSAETALLSASFICKQYFAHNPKMQYLAQLLDRDFVDSDIHITSFDPIWDRVTRELGTTLDKIIKEADESIGCADTYYDYYFIKHLDEIEKQELNKVKIKEAKNEFDNMRINLFKAAKEKDSQTKIMKNILADYDVLLQFKQLRAETKVFKKGVLSYFSVSPKKHREKDKAGQRFSMLSLRKGGGLTCELPEKPDKVTVTTNYGFNFEPIPYDGRFYVH